MSEEISFEKIKSILNRYNTPEKQKKPLRVCSHKKCISSINVIDLTNELISRDLSKMDSYEYKKYRESIKLIYKKLHPRSSFKTIDTLCAMPNLLTFIILFINCILSKLYLK